MSPNQYTVQPEHTGASEFFDYPPSPAIGREVTIRSQPSYQITSPLGSVLCLLRLYLEFFDSIQKLRCLRADVFLVDTDADSPSEVPIRIALDESSDEGSFQFRELLYFG